MNIEDLSWMWTTHLHEFFLLKLEGYIDFAIIRIIEGPPKIVGVFNIEGNKLYRIVQQRMLDEGIKVITQDELSELRKRD